MFNPTEPYNDLPKLAEVEYDPSARVLKLAEDTRVAIAVLDYAIQRLPSPEVLLDILALQEAKSSSYIENIRTSNDDLYKSVSLESFNTETKEVSDYKDALMYGYDRIKTSGAISLTDIEKINEPVNKMGNGIRRNLPGFGASTRIVKGTGQDEQIIYTPPHGEILIKSLLIDTLEYLYDDEQYELNPLIKIALAHYQFECIHPFSDGNGRTGRILNLLFLCQKKYLSSPILYASSYILNNKNEYYELLDLTKQTNDFEPFVTYMLNSFKVTAEKTLKIVEKIDQLMNQFTDKNYLSKFNGQYELQKLVVDFIFKKVYVQNSDIVGLGLHRQTAASYLNQFAEDGLLIKEKHGKENIYKNIKLLELFNNEV